MNKTIDLKQLSPEQKADLMEQLKSENAAKKNREKAERESYKTIVGSTVEEQFVKLEQLSSNLSIAKADIYRQFAAIIELKQELYGAKSGQMSHTFTDEDGRSITIGWRQVDEFNDTLDMGIALISEYITTLAIDENSANLVEMINRLLKKDAQGKRQSVALSITSAPFPDGYEPNFNVFVK